MQAFEIVPNDLATQIFGVNKASYRGSGDILESVFGGGEVVRVAVARSGAIIKKERRCNYL
jgi:hypothetical protein